MSQNSDTKFTHDPNAAELIDAETKKSSSSELRFAGTCAPVAVIAAIGVFFVLCGCGKSAPVVLATSDSIAVEEVAEIEAPVVGEKSETPAPAFVYKQSKSEPMQEAELEEQTINVSKSELKPIYDEVEQMPAFPGGDAALYKFIYSNIIYPVAAAEEGISGRVFVRFVVTKSGEVDRVTVLRGKHPALDKEAIRVVKMLPKFIPGKLNGRNVNVWYILPIVFRLPQQENSHFTPQFYFWK